MSTKHTSDTSLRPIGWAAAFEALLLASIGVMLLALAQHGALVFYIHPRYTPLTLASAAVLLLLGAARVRAIWSAAPEPFGARRWQYLLALIPLLFGMLVPAQPLGAGALSGTGADFASSSAPQDDNTAQWNLLQWAVALSVRGEELGGRPADLVGFVYHDPERPLDGFFSVRYVISCCTADSSGVRLPVVWRGGAALSADTWVRVRATLGSANIAGREEPALIATSVEPVARPANPYLYP